MFHFINDKSFLRRAQTYCSAIVKNVECKCRDLGINSQVFLIGSGAKNLITQNADGPIDFDYNLNIISCPDWNNAYEIKETVRKAFNQVMREYNLDDVQDSTSSLTTYPIHFVNAPSIEFSIDLAIVTKDTSDRWERLIHDKNGSLAYDRWFWNIGPSNTGLRQKVDWLKANGYWEMVRDRYLAKKNLYLSRNDHNHPSFICYIEAVNEVFAARKS